MVLVAATSALQRATSTMIAAFVSIRYWSHRRRELSSGPYSLAMNADELVHLPVGVRAGDHREDRRILEHAETNR
jgi:hypothetical protein